MKRKYKPANKQEELLDKILDRSRAVKEFLIIHFTEVFRLLFIIAKNIVKVSFVIVKGLAKMFIWIIKVILILIIKYRQLKDSKKQKDLVFTVRLK